MDTLHLSILLEVRVRMSLYFSLLTYKYWKISKEFFDSSIQLVD